MNVTVIGAGNIGTYFAVQIAAKGYPVTVYSSRESQFHKEVRMISRDGETKSAELFCVTDDISESVKNADVVFITQPAFMLTETARRLASDIKDSAIIGFVPGTGGCEFAFNGFLKNGGTIFGLQRVPAIARLVKYGEVVDVEGKRDRLHLGAMPSGKAPELAQWMEELFDMPCEVLPNYLSVTLTPSNPILHTVRLRTMFSTYTTGKVYRSVPLFYENWDDEASKLLIACDKELQLVCYHLKELDLSAVKSLKDHYGCQTAREFTEKIKSIKAFRGIETPMCSCGEGFVPDFSSRYFTADFSFGLDIIYQISHIVGVQTPFIDETLMWYRDVSNDRRQIDLKEYGLSCIEEIYHYYS